ncbi:MAG: universal stress protein [Bacteroidales bacterium]|jgi:nucleotide-binding universal stress UspA family protein|nr:universal stress protein [Bacteroidales bacterium]
MKNVIVGIDFSEGSLNAMSNAISIAERFKSNLVLLFVLTPDAKILIEGEDEVQKANVINLAKEKMERLVKDCQRRLPPGKVEYKIRMGKPAREINAEAKERKAPLIVLGTHGCSGFEEFFLGSSARRTISASSSPVLTVRYGIDVYRDFINILVIIDDTRETLQKLRIAAKVAKAFHAKVIIMGLYPQRYPDLKKTVEAYVSRAGIFLTEHNVRFSTDFVKKGEPVETVLNYVKKNDVNLIIVMKEVELNGDNVFMLANFSEKMVHRSPVPVLTVHVDESIY